MQHVSKRLVIFQYPWVVTFNKERALVVVLALNLEDTILEWLGINSSSWPDGGEAYLRPRETGSLYVFVLP